MYRTIQMTVVSVMLLLTAGCVNPNGTQNNTGTGALIGSAVGALVGAAADRRNPAAGALIGAAAGALTGAFAGHIADQIDERQREQLQRESPQTLQTIQHNDQIVQQQQAAPPPPPPAAGQPAAAPTPAPAAETPTPLTVNDIKALTAAGVKSDYIIQEIGDSKAVFSSADIATAQQASPPVSQDVIDCMKSHSS